MAEQPFICHPRIAQRDASRLKWQEKRAAERGEWIVKIQEWQKAPREKGCATVGAFIRMAKEKFGQTELFRPDLRCWDRLRYQSSRRCVDIQWARYLCLLT